MTTLLWTMAVVCWSISALLVFSVVYPDLAAGQRLAGQNEPE